MTSRPAFELHQSLDALSDREREHVSAAVGRVSELLVSENPRYWSALTSLTDGDRGVALAFKNDEPVGFWLVERLTVGQARVLYSALTNVVPASQGEGISWQLRCRFLLQQMETGNDRPSFLAFRTRNPIAWQLNAKFCKTWAPDIFAGPSDEGLLDLGWRVARCLYPEHNIEFPSLVMADVYPPACCGAKQQHHRDPAIDAAFFTLPALSIRENGRFFIGELKAVEEIQALDGH
jgi:hypothetical protein